VARALRGISYGSILPGDILYWQKRILALSALIPVIWLAFSVTYARADASRYFSRWKPALIGSGSLVVLFVILLRKSLFTGEALLQDAARWSLPLADQASDSTFVLVADPHYLQPERPSGLRRTHALANQVSGVAGNLALRIYWPVSPPLFAPPG
jgi:hypothetical protein